MREILFRGKMVNSDKWCFGTYAAYESGEAGIFSQKFSRCGYEAVEISYRNKVVPETIGQFTGLIDRNGTKIFEGDIVMLPDEENPCLIKWDDDAARFVIDGDVCVDFDNYYGNDLEVIGNIHDKGACKDSEGQPRAPFGACSGTEAEQHRKQPHIG